MRKWAAQQARGRWSDMRARCNFLGVPQRISASGWELSQIGDAHTQPDTHTDTGSSVLSVLLFLLTE